MNEFSMNPFFQGPFGFGQNMNAATAAIMRGMGLDNKDNKNYGQNAINGALGQAATSVMPPDPNAKGSGGMNDMLGMAAAIAPMAMMLL